MYSKNSQILQAKFTAIWFAQNATAFIRAHTVQNVRFIVNNFPIMELIGFRVDGKPRHHSCNVGLSICCGGQKENKYN